MPTITLSDLSLAEHGLTPRVAALKDAYFRAMSEICVERALLVTQASIDQGLFGKPRITCLDKAKLYRRVLEPLGYSCEVDLTHCKEARCNLVIIKKGKSS